MLFLSSFVPALAAAAHTGHVADAAHDEGAVRAFGLGWTGAFRALDQALSALVMALPIGTRATRAGIACAVMMGVLGGVLYRVTRRVLEACTDGAVAKFSSAVACVASLTATTGAALQLEAASPGGTVTGVVLALLPLALLAGAGDGAKRIVGMPTILPSAALAAGLALAYDPLTGAAAFASGLTFLAARGALRPALSRPLLLRALAFFILGTAPFFLSLAGAHLRPLSLGSPAFAEWTGEAGASAPIAPLTFVQDEIGLLVAALALVGAALAFLVVRARPLASALLTLALLGVAATGVGAPGGPTRFGAAALTGVVAVIALAAVAMQAIVRVVANAKVPFAKTSAAMIVVLLVTFPVHNADDAMARSMDRARGASRGWDEAAIGPIPSSAVVLVSEARVMTHVLAARAEGELRADLAVVPAFNLGGSLARRELSREPTLSPFFRDMALGALPEEYSFSSVAVHRPLVVAYDPRWERSLSRHFVPVGLFTAFETEPRGASDRRKALELLAKGRDALKADIGEDAELLALTTNLLRVRAIALAAAGDKDVVARGVEELRAFAPDDRLAAQLARRVAQAKASSDVVARPAK